MGRVASWGPNFRISFGVNITSYLFTSVQNNQWASLLHFTNDPSRDCCKIGQRIPAILLSTYNTTGSLASVNVYTQIGDDANYVYEVLGMEVKTWYDVVVEQILEDSKVNILISKLKYNLYSF